MKVAKSTGHLSSFNLNHIVVFQCLLITQMQTEEQVSYLLVIQMHLVWGVVALSTAFLWFLWCMLFSCSCLVVLYIGSSLAGSDLQVSSSTFIFAPSCCWCWILMESATTGIPTGAPLATSPFETSTYFCAWSCEDDVRDVDRDWEVMGGFRWGGWCCFFPHFLVFSFSWKLFFCVFSWAGRRMMLGMWFGLGNDGKEVWRLQEDLYTFYEASLFLKFLFISIYSSL